MESSKSSSSLEDEAGWPSEPNTTYIQTAKSKLLKGYGYCSNHAGLFFIRLKGLSRNLGYEARGDSPEALEA